MIRTMTAVCLLALSAAGCTKYYKVTDPTTGKTYFTTDLKRSSTGGVVLKDGRTGNTVNIQNSESNEITKEEFDAGRFAAPKEMEAEKPAANSNPFK